MLSKKIIKVPERIWQPAGIRIHEPDLKNQDELNFFLLTAIKPGAVVTYKTNPQPTSLHMIAFVVGVCNEYARLTFSNWKKEAETHQLVQLGQITNTAMKPYERWAPIGEYQLLTEQQQKIFIDDNVQNHLQRLYPNVIQAAQAV